MGCCDPSDPPSESGAQREATPPPPAKQEPREVPAKADGAPTSAPVEEAAPALAAPVDEEPPPAEEKEETAAPTASSSASEPPSQGGEDGGLLITFSDASSSSISTISDEEPLDVVVVHDGAIRSAALGLHLYTPRASECEEDMEEEEAPEAQHDRGLQEREGEEGEESSEEEAMATSVCTESVNRSVHPSASQEFESVERSPQRHRQREVSPPPEEVPKPPLEEDDKHEEDEDEEEDLPTPREGTVARGEDDAAERTELCQTPERETQDSRLEGTQLIESNQLSEEKKKRVEEDGEEEWMHHGKSLHHEDWEDEETEGCPSREDGAPAPAPAAPMALFPEEADSTTSEPNNADQAVVDHRSLIHSVTTPKEKSTEQFVEEECVYHGKSPSNPVSPPAEEQPAEDEQPVEDEQPAEDEQPTEEQPAEEQPAEDEQPTEEQPAEEQPAEDEEPEAAAAAREGTPERRTSSSERGSSAEPTSHAQSPEKDLEDGVLASSLEPSRSQEGYEDGKTPERQSPDPEQDNGDDAEPTSHAQSPEKNLEDDLLMSSHEASKSQEGHEDEAEPLFQSKSSSASTTPTAVSVEEKLTQLSDQTPVVRAVIAKDAYYHELRMEKEECAAGSSTERVLRILMAERIEQIVENIRRASVAKQQAEELLRRQYPFLMDSLLLVEPPVLDLLPLRLHDDKQFAQLAVEHSEVLALLSSPSATAEDDLTRLHVEQTMSTHAVRIASEVAAEEDLWTNRLSPLALRSPLLEVISLRDLHLASHEGVVRRLELLEANGDADRFEEARLRHELMALVLRITEEAFRLHIAQWMEEYNLREQYPFLPQLPGGLCLSDVGFANSANSRHLVAALRAMTRAPHKPEEKASLRTSLIDHTSELAFATLRATESVQQRFPCLSRRVNGVLLADLPVDLNSVLQKYEQQRMSDPTTISSELEREVQEEAMHLASKKTSLELYRADENDAVRCRHPFFPYSEVLLIPLRDLRVEQSKRLRKVMKQRVQAKTAAPGTKEAKVLAQIDMELVAYCTNKAAELLASDEKHAQLYMSPGTRDSAAIPFHSLHALRDDEVLTDVRFLHAKASGKMVDDEEDRAQERVLCRCDELLSRYEVTEERIALYLQRLRLDNPFCCNDVNPVVSQDQCFAALQTMYVDWSQILLPSHELMRATEKEIEERATAMVRDERSVLDAACALHDADAALRLSRTNTRSSAAELALLIQQRDEAHYGHELWRLRHLRRRLPPLVEHEEPECVWIELALEPFSAPEQDTYYTFLQAKKYEFAAEGRTAASRCADELLKRRSMQLKADTGRQAGALQRKHQQWLQGYHFLRVPPLLALVSREFLVGDAQFRDLDAERCRLLRPPVDLQERYPFLETTADGARINSLGLATDPVFLRLAASHDDIVAPFRRRLLAVKEVEKSMRQRFYCCVDAFLTEEKRIAEDFSFLNLPKFTVPLQCLHLSGDRILSALREQYEAVHQQLVLDGIDAADDVEEGPNGKEGEEKKRKGSKADAITGHIDVVHADNVNLRRKELLRLAMRDRVVLIARGEHHWRTAQLMEVDSLQARLPHLSAEPLDGIQLTDLHLLNDPVFLKLAVQVEETQNAVTRMNASTMEVPHKTRVWTSDKADLALIEVEAHVEARARDARAALQVARQRHPHLPERVLGVLACQLDLPPPAAVAEVDGNEEQQQPDAEAARLLEVYRTAAVNVKARMMYTIGENEAIRARHPFLEWADIRGVPLVQLFKPGMTRSFLDTRKAWLQAAAREVTMHEEMASLEGKMQELLLSMAGQLIELSASQWELAQKHVDLGCIQTDLSDLLTVVDVTRFLGSSDANTVKQRAQRVESLQHSVLEAGDVLFHVDRIYAASSNAFVEELIILREDHPLVLMDVNPIIATDAKLLKLERSHTKPMEDFTQHVKVALRAMEGVEKSIRLRAASLVQDDAFVVATVPMPSWTPREEGEEQGAEGSEAAVVAAQQCEQVISTDHPLMVHDRLKERCVYYLRDCHLFHRLVGFSEIRERGGKLLPARRSRDSSKRSRSSASEPTLVPENDYHEIEEDSVQTSVVTTVYNAPSSARSNERRSPRHQRAPSPPSAAAAEPVPDEEVNNEEPAPVAEAEDQPEEGVAAVIVPKAPANDQQQHTGRRRARKHRRGDGAASGTSQNGIPQEVAVDQAGEVLERDTEFIDATQPLPSPRGSVGSRSSRKSKRRQRRRQQPLAAARLRATIRHAKVHEDEAGEMPSSERAAGGLPVSRLLSRQEREHRETSAFIVSSIERSAAAVNRPVREEEVRADTTAMERVYEYHDLQRAVVSPAAKQMVLARLSEIDRWLCSWLVSTSRTVPVAPAADVMESKALVIKKARATQRRLQQQSSSSGEQQLPPPGFSKEDAWGCRNPRAVPQLWAHLRESKLRSDEKLNTLVHSSDATAKDVFAYLVQTASQLEAKNVALYQLYPFLPVISHGLTLEEIGFEADAEFNAAIKNEADYLARQQRAQAVVERLAAAKAAELAA